MTNDEKRLRGLGLRIRKARKSAALTQERLAELCAFDPTYISLLERGRRNPPFLTLCKLADELEWPLDRLVEGMK